MERVKFCKTLSSLPPTEELTADTLYFVRVGTGFDIYLTTKKNGVIIPRKLNSNVYGLDFHFAQELGELTTTANTYQTALTLTTSELINSFYRISVNFRFGMSQTNRDFYSRLLLNGNPLGNPLIQRPTRSINRIFQSYSKIIQLSGVNTFELQYHGSGGVAYISDRMIEFWRVQ